jgi:threonine dehydrogenase-like Zn-dependent dehydrogenase
VVLNSAVVREPLPGEVRVRVVASGICGTDVEFYEGHVPVAFERVMGHEGAGVVDSVPAGGELEVGTPVVIDPVIACGSCSACRDDAPNLCLRGGLLGRDLDGVFAEYVLVPEVNCFPLPDAVDLPEAPAIQVLATVAHAQELVGVVPTRIAAVIGLGFTGQLHVQLLLRRGARVLGITRSEAKRTLARELACEWVSSPDDAPAVSRALGVSNAPDLVVEASGTVPGLAQAIELLRPGGTILWYGTCTAREGRLPFYSVYHKEARILASRASKPRDMETAISLLASGAISVAPLITDRMGLDDVKLGLERSRDGALKVMLEH